MRFVFLKALRPSADALSLGIGWDAMGLTGMNIGVGEGARLIAEIAVIGNHLTTKDTKKHEVKTERKSKY